MEIEDAFHALKPVSFEWMWNNILSFNKNTEHLLDLPLQDIRKNSDAAMRGCMAIFTSLLVFYQEDYLLIFQQQIKKRKNQLLKKYPSHLVPDIIRIF